jgi:hypothetical protein
VTAFELNEDLKERCILLGATSAITVRFKDGVPIVPDEFWETVIRMPETTHNKYIQVVASLIEEYLVMFEKNKYECADIEFAYQGKCPYLIYAVFPGKKSFTKAQLKHKFTDL